MFKTELAYENWASKYRYKNEQPIETFQRIAKALASVEKKEEQDLWYRSFLETMVRLDADGNPVGLKFTPGGRITANVGTEYSGATLINCFISAPVSSATVSYKRHSEESDIEYDVEYKTGDNPDDLVNIFLTILEQAKTLASEGGYGVNFDWIRPRGALIKGIGIRHPGVLAYMKIWDSVSECIVKGTNDGYIDKLKNYLKNSDNVEEVKTTVKAMARKGAMLGCLSVSHPDIEEFIRAKQTSGVLTKFNISVLIDDAFMQAVEKDDLYNLHFKGTVYKVVKARELYNLIMESCYNRAEPGVLFYDNMHKNNPLAYLGHCNATNPCGEVPGLSTLTTVCLLGSYNLTQYIEVKDGKPCFDWDSYEKDIATGVRMLDNVNDITYSPLPSYLWAIQNLRQIGLGINGLGSALFMLGIRYNSKEALDFIKKVCEIKENISWQTSALLAKERGTFKAYRKDEFESTPYFLSDRITRETKGLLKKHGARNGKTTTNPPLGNTSVICDNVSNGIEPVYSLEYERKVICKEWPEGLNEDNVKKILTAYKEKDYRYWQGEYAGKMLYYEPHNRGLCEVITVRDYGYQWCIDTMSDKKNAPQFVTTKDLDIEDHINVQAMVQYYCNQSCSKTCNLPNNYSFSKFQSLYMEAWKKGLVGFTTYREGSMESVLSDISTAAHSNEIIKRDIKLPNTFINGPTSIIKKEGKKFYIHFSYLPEDSALSFPVCMWIYTNAKYEKDELRICNKGARELARLSYKCGLDEKIIEDALNKAKNDYPHNRLGRMISLNLRHNVPREDILVSLAGIEGDSISSLVTAVRKFIGETIPDGTPLKGMKCPNCGGDLVMESGCKICVECKNQLCG